MINSLEGVYTEIFTGLVHKGTRETGVLCSVLVLSVSVSISPR